MADGNQAQAVGANVVKKPVKTSIVEVFMKGAKKGFYIGVEQILPAMILGYVIIQFLKLTGLIEILSVVFGPIMGIFGLPGEAIVVLLSAFFSKAAGAAAAANLFGEGVLTAAQCTILVMPCMLMGTLIGHFARIILVSDVNPKHRGLMLLVPLVDSVVGMLVMKLILTVMGLM
ncbi:nucleoside recognition domain-containing protein [Anaerotignum sp.]|uniref:nucleoside recognition domain-containing protein n=1 Tax=Anaerotignum sp. TaxID=2039241 RepID=UPI002899FA0B|nr:nucleoside recognition domain-containing protein [Anaerotignum sp.]